MKLMNHHSCHPFILPSEQMELGQYNFAPSGAEDQREEQSGCCYSILVLLDKRKQQ